MARKRTKKDKVCNKKIEMPLIHGKDNKGYYYLWVIGKKTRLPKHYYRLENVMEKTQARYMAIRDGQVKRGKGHTGYYQIF